MKLSYDNHPSHEIRKIHEELASLRDRIHKVIEDDKLWKDWLTPLIGGTTCLMIAAYDSYEAMRVHQEKWYPKPIGLDKQEN
jgi:hypothetical protein